jgi:hypothetical protein
MVLLLLESRVPLPRQMEVAYLLDLLLLALNVQLLVMPTPMPRQQVESGDKEQRELALHRVAAVTSYRSSERLHQHPLRKGIERCVGTDPMIVSRA